MSNQVGDFLEHHGVKGMHWGSHKSGYSGGSSSSGSNGAKKKYTTQEIIDARLRQNSRINKISQHADDLNLHTSAKGRAAAAKIYEKSVNEYINSPDGPVAAKMTKGEKVITAFGVAIIGATMASIVAH